MIRERECGRFERCDEMRGYDMTTRGSDYGFRDARNPILTTFPYDGQKDDSTEVCIEISSL